MIKKLLFFNMLWILSAIIQAQDSSASCYKSSEEAIIFDECLTGTTINTPMVYIGDPFFTTKWSKGGVTLENNHTLNGKILKYNALMDELFWLRDADYRQIIVKKEMVKEFFYIMDDSTFTFRKLKIKPVYINDSIHSYLQVIAEGKINLYVKRDVQIKNGTNELLSNNYYYIQLQDNSVQSFEPSRRKILNLVGTKRELMRQILRSEKLKVSKEDQLIRAIKKFNSVVL